MSEKPVMRGALLLTVTGLSGVAGLGYEIVWTRMLAQGLGHETPSVLAVLAAFFGGSAIGAFFLDKPISSSRSPARWYAGLESVICLWAIALAFILPAIGSWTAALIGPSPTPLRQWIASFAVPFLALFPATAAMGGTLIAVERILSRFSGSAAVPPVYCANTAGAAAGVAATSFLMLPTLGFSRSLLVLSICSALCAAAISIARIPDISGGAGASRREPEGGSAPNGSVSIYIALFFTGLLGVGYEVLMVRALSQVMENTAYSFASILVIYLLGTAIGAALREKIRFHADNLAVSILLAVTTCAGAILLRFLPEMYEHGESACRGSMISMTCFEFGIASLVLLAPTAAMGFAFSHLSQTARKERGGFGRAIAINTFGAMLAPPLFGVALLPRTGLNVMLTGVAISYLALTLIPGFAPVSLRRRALLAIVAVALTAAGSATIPAATHFIKLNHGDRIVHSVDGVMATCTVVQDAAGERHLRFNSRFQEGGTGSPMADRREAAIPLLLHGAPRTALFLGVGAGITFATSAWFDSLLADGVELVPEMKQLLPCFTGDLPPRHLTVLCADARRYALACNKRYDVIVADLYHPARDGAGQLYTIEHFTAIRNLLARNGIFCQWLPLYQMNERTLRDIARTFTAVFPEAGAWLANYSVDMPIIGLIGSVEPIRLSLDAIERQNKHSDMRERLESIRLYSTISLAGLFLGGKKTLTRFAGSGPLNTDDFPRIMFDAPRFVYGADRQDPLSLAKLLIDSLNDSGAAVVSAIAGVQSAATARRLTRYRAVRDRFLRLGIRTAASGADRSTEAARDSLLSYIKISGDFEAAYNPLIGLALRMSLANRDDALSLLRELAEASPQRPEAGELIRQIEDRRP